MIPTLMSRESCRIIATASKGCPSDFSTSPWTSCFMRPVTCGIKDLRSLAGPAANEREVEEMTDKCGVFLADRLVGSNGIDIDIGISGVHEARHGPAFDPT